MVLENFEKDDLSISISEDSYKAVLKWSGNCTINISRTELMTFLEQCVSEFSGKKLVLDFKALQFINSAAVAALINFIRTLKDSNSIVDFTYDQYSIWQATTFSTFEIISKPLPNVRVFGE